MSLRVLIPALESHWYSNSLLSFPFVSGNITWAPYLLKISDIAYFYKVSWLVILGPIRP